MRIETFRGRDIAAVSASVQTALGDDALIVRTRVLRARPTPLVEVVAAVATDVERLRRRLEPDAVPHPRLGGQSGRPRIVALVGPTGSGKTTTLAKLGVHPQAFGSWKVGLLTLDTFRTGAVEQLTNYAEIAGLPMEVVYTREEVEPALARLAECDVVLVDSPGRSPRHPERNAAWLQLLGRLRPDEVHLVIPAAIRLDVAAGVLDAYEAAGVTHLLLTKLDEVIEDAGVADAAVELRLPVRWVTDGQEIPLDLHPALPRVLGSLGGYTGGRQLDRISA